MDQHVAQATNLVFFIPTAIAAVIVGMKNKNIQIKLAMPIIIFGTIGAAIGANFSMHMEATILRKMFGIFLLCIAMYEIHFWYQRYIKAKMTHTKDKT